METVYHRMGKFGDVGDVCILIEYYKDKRNHKRSHIRYSHTHRVKLQLFNSHAQRTVGDDY